MIIRQILSSPQPPAEQRTRPMQTLSCGGLPGAIREGDPGYPPLDQTSCHDLSPHRGWTAHTWMDATAGAHQAHVDAAQGGELRRAAGLQQRGRARLAAAQPAEGLRMGRKPGIPARCTDDA